MFPRDEGLIDYVNTEFYGAASDENPYYGANVVSNETMVLSGRTIDATAITRELLAATLHEVDGLEANVATGYHAIDALLAQTKAIERAVVVLAIAPITVEGSNSPDAPRKMQ